VSIEENKRLALRFIEEMVAGRRERVEAMLTDDAVLFYWGDFWFSGRMTVDEYFTRIHRAGEGKFQAGNSASGAPYLEIHIGEITAEDDRVCVEAEDWIPLPDGTTLNPQFHLFFKIRDGKVAEFKDYVDSHHLYLGLRGGDGKGPRPGRESNIFDVKHVITGGGPA
jgi:uncharacterized protein